MSNDVDEDPLAEAYNRGLMLEKSGDVAGAAEAYRTALTLDPADHGGAAVRLAAMGAGETPDRAPEAYVTTLFDQHAEAFDAILVGQLGYHVPEMLPDLLAAHATGAFAHMLDLGCGTGLSGLTMAPFCTRITGVDLAEEMVALADKREVYDQLFIGDAVQFLIEEDESYDLIVATDVMPYLGDLAPIFDGVAGCLSPGGTFVFSTETTPEDHQHANWQVGAGHRFAHAEPYIRTALQDRGFTIRTFQPITVRTEEDMPVPGHLVLARGPAPS